MNVSVKFFTSIVKYDSLDFEMELEVFSLLD